MMVIRSASTRLVRGRGRPSRTTALSVAMPAVVEEFAQTGDLGEARRLQLQILVDYERDFGKHVPVRLLPKMHDLWDSIPAHLSHENKKFVFGRSGRGHAPRTMRRCLPGCRRPASFTGSPE